MGRTCWAFHQIETWSKHVGSFLTPWISHSVSLWAVKCYEPQCLVFERMKTVSLMFGVDCSVSSTQTNVSSCSQLHHISHTDCWLYHLCYLDVKSCCLCLALSALFLWSSWGFGRPTPCHASMIGVCSWETFQSTSRLCRGELLWELSEDDPSRTDHPIVESISFSSGLKED